MKEIQLTRGYVAIVDDDDYEKVSAFKWQVHTNERHAYATSGKYSKNRILMHRFVLGLENGRSPIVDHINGNGLDNRKENLRPCTYSQNLRNAQKRRKPCSSSYKGVTRKNERIWVVHIYDNGKLKSLGSFKDEVDAARAYDAKARELFGEFARTNF